MSLSHVQPQLSDLDRGIVALHSVAASTVVGDEEVQTDALVKDLLQQNEIRRIQLVAVKRSEGHLRVFRNISLVTTIALAIIGLVSDGLVDAYNGDSESNKRVRLGILYGFGVVVILATVVTVVAQVFFEGKVDEKKRLTELTDTDKGDLKKLRYALQNIGALQRLKEQDEDISAISDRCLFCLKDLPERIHGRELPSRDCFLSAVIQVLPPTHPVKQAAVRIYFEDQDDDHHLEPRGGDKKEKHHFKDKGHRASPNDEGIERLAMGMRPQDPWERLRELTGLNVGRLTLSSGEEDRLVTMRNPRFVPMPSHQVGSSSSSIDDMV